MLTLAEAGALLGRSPSTLRHQIKSGRLKGRLVGKTWIVSAAEVERYRRVSLGRPGRASRCTTLHPRLGRCVLSRHDYTDHRTPCRFAPSDETRRRLAELEEDRRRPGGDLWPAHLDPISGKEHHMGEVRDPLTGEWHYQRRR